MVHDPSRSWRLFALVVLTFSATCAAASVVMLLVHRQVPDPATYWVVDLVCSVVYGVTAVLMLPRTRHPAAWIMAVVAVGCGLSALATMYRRLELAHDVPDGDALWVAALPVWTLGTYATLAVLPWLVSRGRLPFYARALAGAAAAVIVLAAIAALTMTIDVPYNGTRGSAIHNPFEVPWQPWQEAVAATWYWPERICVVVGVLGLARLATLWWRRRGTTEQGYGWLVVGQLLLVCAMVPIVFAKMKPGDLLLELAGASLLAAQAFLPIALLVVVLGQQLWGIDAAVSRLAVWMLLTGTVVALYVAAVWVVVRLLPISDQAAGMLVALGIALVAHPARLQLQRRVDMMVYGADSDPAAMLARLGEQLRHGRESGALPALAESIRTGLRLGAVQVQSLTNPDVRAETGPLTSARAVVLPLVVDRRHVGDLTMTPPPGQRLDPRTLSVAGDLSDIVAVALELDETNRRLQGASERLGAVRHEERRMLRRELHDSLGPVLAGVTMGLAASRRMIETDPAGADRLLAELEAEIAGRSNAVRELSRSLLPTELDDGDLVAALEVLARRFGGGGLVVRVVADGLGQVGTKHQVAVYYVAAEALLNVHRHSGATTATITVSGGDGDPVVLEVVDDGRGIDGDAIRGVGLQSMRERADELAGTIEVAPGARGGTRVRLELP
jgi:signal transduction histidine kinase